jgi:hypothetical protein
MNLYTDKQRAFTDQQTKLHRILELLDFDWAKATTWDAAYAWIPEGSKILADKVEALRQEWLKEQASISQ